MTNKITNLIKPMPKSVMEAAYNNLLIGDIEAPQVFMSLSEAEAEAEAIVRRGMRELRERQNKFGLTGLRNNYKKMVAKKNINRHQLIEKLLTNAGFPWRLVSNVHGDTSLGKAKLRDDQCMYFVLEAEHNGFNIVTVTPSSKEVMLVRRNIKITHHSMARIVMRRSTTEKLDLFDVMPELTTCLPALLTVSIKLEHDVVNAELEDASINSEVYAPTPNGMFVLRYDQRNLRTGAVTWVTDDQAGSNQEQNIKEMMDGFGEIVKDYTSIVSPDRCRQSNTLIHYQQSYRIFFATVMIVELIQA
ncbi:hypothetical protein I3271_07405 [Photobacterium leiognathi]|uniref:hypothetical protein n=1 Tax=Photobacterium leiognathi TaxID=553611 RepID=UPI001EDF36A1|nr:hypothetical protein [Photobacterium leiognathi]MCG3884512.1 hypothetical protein [Photobacterium leiognathi]